MCTSPSIINHYQQRKRNNQKNINKNRLTTLSRNCLCTSAIKKYLGKPWDDSSVIAALIPLLKEIDPREGHGEDQGPKRWDDIQPWEVKDWPRTEDILGGKFIGTADYCSGAAPVFPIRFLASAATFGMQLKDVPLVGELATYPSGFKLNLCEKPPQQAANWMKGKIVLADRGGCTFHAKAVVAAEIGVSGLIIVSHKAENPETMSDYPSDKPLIIPLAMISKRDGANLRRLLNFNRSLIAHIGKSKSPLELLHSGVASAATSFGMVLWRATRVVPPFVPTFKFGSASLDASYLNVDFENFSFGESIPQPPIIHTHTGHRCNNKAISRETISMNKATADEILLSAGGKIKAYTCNFKDMCLFYSECDLVVGPKYYSVLIVEDDGSGRLQLQPREATAVLIAPIFSIEGIGNSLSCLNGISNQKGWLLSHLYTHTDVNSNKHNAAWLQVSWQDETFAKNSIRTHSECGKNSDLGSVVRIYKQPVAWMGSVLHLRWFSLREDVGGSQEQNFLLVMDMLQKQYSSEKGFLGREVIEIPLSPPANHRYIDVSQWKSNRDARESEISVESSPSWEIVLGIISDLKVEITAPLHTATHSEAHMPQQPMTEECVQTWDCSVPASDEKG